MLCVIDIIVLTMSMLLFTTDDVLFINNVVLRNLYVMFALCLFYFLCKIVNQELRTTNPALFHPYVVKVDICGVS